MKKVLLIICLIMMLSGCSAESTATDSPHKVLEDYELESAYDESEMQTDENAPWRYEVAERLFDEFCYFYDNMEEKELLEEQYEEMQLNKKPLGYNCIMAMDRLVGISMVYHKYLPEEKLEVFRQKYFVLEYARHYTNIRFSYTTSGLHFISIYYVDYDDYTAPVNYEAINRLRGLDNEYAFLTDFADASQYDAVDLFAEDLSGSIQDINISFAPQFDLKALDPPGVVEPINLDDESKRVLQKYDRNATYGDFKNNEWNLYVLKEHKIFESISSNGEFAQMTNFWMIP